MHFIIIFIKFQVPIIIVLNFLSIFIYLMESFTGNQWSFNPVLLLFVKLLLKYFKHTSVNFALSEIQSKPGLILV